MKTFIKLAPLLVIAVIALLVPHHVVTLDTATVIIASAGALCGVAFIGHYSVNVPKWWSSRFGRDAVTPVFLLSAMMGLAVWSTLAGLQVSDRTWAHYGLFSAIFLFLFRRYVLYLWTRSEQLIEEARTGLRTDEKVPGEDAAHPYLAPDKEGR